MTKIGHEDNFKIFVSSNESFDFGNYFGISL